MLYLLTRKKTKIKPATTIQVIFTEGAIKSFQIVDSYNPNPLVPLIKKINKITFKKKKKIFTKIQVFPFVSLPPPLACFSFSSQKDLIKPNNMELDKWVFFLPQLGPTGSFIHDKDMG